MLLGLGATLAFITWANGYATRKQKALFDTRTSPDAQVRAVCAVRDGCSESPGVAQVKDGTLTVHTLFGNSYEAQLDQVKLLACRKNWIFGSPQWIGKTCFRLECPPYAPRLTLGFSDPTPWMGLFKDK